jgi:hypothetical protein
MGIMESKDEAEAGRESIRDRLGEGIGVDGVGVG